MNVDYAVELRFALSGDNTEDILKKIHMIMKGRTNLTIDIYAVAVNPIKVDTKITQVQQ